MKAEVFMKYKLTHIYIYIYFLSYESKPMICDLYLNIYIYIYITFNRESYESWTRKYAS